MGTVKNSDDIFFTKSMAEVLEGQGKYEDAMMIYSILEKSATTPNDALYFKGKFDELKNRAVGRK